MSAETQTAVLGNATFHVTHKPYFRVVKAIPEGMSPKIERAVVDFIKTSHVPKGVDIGGFYQQTLEAIANSTYLGGSGDFWLGTLDDEITTYVLGHVGKDLDHRLTYTVTQAWVAKKFRGDPVVKEWWAAIRARAKSLFAKHLVIISSRNPKAYIRFLGNGMHTYCSMLKEEI